MDYETQKEPYFRITQPFFNGTQLIEPGKPGEILCWVPPGEDGWDRERLGPHHMEQEPSITFEPLNEPARKLLAKCQERVAKVNAPKPSVSDVMQEQLALMNAMILKVMNENLETKAELRRLREEKEEAEEGKKGKK